MTATNRGSNVADSMHVTFEGPLQPLDPNRRGVAANKSSRQAEIGADVDGQQWIWVVMVLIGAALVAAVMVFGHQRLRLVDRMRSGKRRNREPGNSSVHAGNPDDAPAARSRNQ